ncbi:hypothetical protein [Halopseudomonas sabulinigri]|uniref:hypothetical protein n=1 Tax=Halopseudomonas sabulinigri TaxID=472181 RepID=UPI00334204A0
MRSILVLLTTIALMLSTQISSANTDPDRLAKGCVELLQIYNKHEDQRFAASLTTSLSEATRAGYCRGVIDEYNRHHECDSPSWYDQAAVIAKHAHEESDTQTTDSLMAKACGG